MSSKRKDKEEEELEVLEETEKKVRIYRLHRESYIQTTSIKKFKRGDFTCTTVFVSSINGMRASDYISRIWKNEYSILDTITVKLSSNYSCHSHLDLLDEAFKLAWHIRNIEEFTCEDSMNLLKAIHNGEIGSCLKCPVACSLFHHSVVKSTPRHCCKVVDKIEY